jgi:hypothetical protein
LYNRVPRCRAMPRPAERGTRMDKPNCFRCHSPQPTANPRPSSRPIRSGRPQIARPNRPRRLVKGRSCSPAEDLPAATPPGQRIRVSGQTASLPHQKPSRQSPSGPICNLQSANIHRPICVGKPPSPAGHHPAAPPPGELQRALCAPEPSRRSSG